MQLAEIQFMPLLVVAEDPPTSSSFLMLFFFMNFLTHLKTSNMKTTSKIKRVIMGLRVFLPNHIPACRSELYLEIEANTPRGTLCFAPDKRNDCVIVPVHNQNNQNSGGKTT